jgi:hypothetical protein
MRQKTDINLKDKMHNITIMVSHLEHDAIKKMIKGGTCQAVSVSDFIRIAIREQINYELNRTKMLTEYIHALEYVEDFQ